jgi:hypothetical protein
MTLKKTTPKDSGKKILLTGFLAAALILASWVGAEAEILTDPSQIINLVAVSDSTGLVPFNALQLIPPDGGAPATWSFPSGRVLVVTALAFTFQATDTQLNQQVVLTDTSSATGFVPITVAITGGVAKGSTTVSTGFVVGPAFWNSNTVFKVARVGDPQMAAIPGTLKVRVHGFIYPAP